MLRDDAAETNMRSLIATFALLLLGSHCAEAAIRITASRYEDGVLIVSGQVRPGQSVTLDSKYKTKADGGGHFEFRVQHYEPPYCMSDIAAGDDSYSAVIAGCFLTDAAAEQNAGAKKTSTHGPAPMKPVRNN
jgi:hypothetical protein